MKRPAAKVAVVTGAARGIGYAIARKFLGLGYRVALLDIDRAMLRKSFRRLSEHGRVLAQHCDVSNPRQVRAAIGAVARRFRRIDALVNNAGIAVFKPILKTSAKEWMRVLDVNLTGPFLCTQACALVMLKNGELSRPVDWFDLFYHGIPWLLLIIKAGASLKSRTT